MWASTVLLALREIRRNLLRSFLTILGIVIGVSAVITMVTLGKGATAAVQAQITSLGSTCCRSAPDSASGRAAAPRDRPASRRPTSRPSPRSSAASRPWRPKCGPA
jgi:putative ABC transport system permease protein